MDGMTRAQIDRVESNDLTPDRSRIRPRDAATLILLERQAGTVKVLMGRRHEDHTFMPGKFVFPGGRTDSDDSRVAVSSDLHPGIVSTFAAMGKTPARARAIALSAVRETYEEAGILIGEPASFTSAKIGWQGFVENRVAPQLGGLTYLARAITPPGRVRRFDAHFFVAWRHSVATELAEGGPTQELQQLVWLTLEEARAIDIPSITKTILGELDLRLTTDPLLHPGGGVPFFHMVGNRFKRDLIS